MEGVLMKKKMQKIAEGASILARLMHFMKDKNQHPENTSEIYKMLFEMNQKAGLQ
jgi:hypothetical protein